MNWLKTGRTRRKLTSMIEKIEVHVEEMRYWRIVTDSS